MSPVDTFYLPAARTSNLGCDTQSQAFFGSGYYSELLDSVPDIVLVVNPDRQVVYANAAATTAAGATPLGQRPGEMLRCIHADEMPGGCGTSAACRHCGAAHALAASGKGQAAVRECRLTVHREKGTDSLDLRVRTNPLAIGEQQFTCFVATDIGAEKRRGALERLFLHDIMNTASNLQGFSRLLERPERLREAQRVVLFQRMQVLSGQIIDEIAAQRMLIQAENDTLATSPEELDALSFLAGVRDAYERNDLLDGRRLQLAPDARTVAFTCDPVLLGRVLGNLVKNAIEASKPGEVVTIGCGLQDGGVVFEVHNSSVMPEAVRLQVFYRSFSTKGEGRGLGTYSVKFFSEHYLGGSVTFSSSQGEGTTFRAWYPLTPAARRGP